MVDDAIPPFRQQFDNARDPYTARNALGIAGTGAGLITSVTSPLSVTGGNLAINLSGYQPLDTELSAIAGLTSAADQAPYFTGSGTAALTTVTAAARTVLDDTTTAAMLTTLGAAPAANFPNTAWSTWTPTFTSTGGTLGSTALTYARYIRLGKTIFLALEVKITNVGTATGTLLFTLPVTASGGGNFFGRETQVSGYILGGNLFSTTQGLLARYDAASPMVLNNMLNFTGLYEVP